MRCPCGREHCLVDETRGLECVSAKVTKAAPMKDSVEALTAGVHAMHFSGFSSWENAMAQSQYAPSPRSAKQGRFVFSPWSCSSCDASMRSTACCTMAKSTATRTHRCGSWRRCWRARCGETARRRVANSRPRLGARRLRGLPAARRRERSQPLPRIVRLEFLARLLRPEGTARGSVAVGAAAVDLARRVLASQCL